MNHTSPPTKDSTKTQLRYPEPHILLMDIETGVVERMLSQGYNVSVGSFGKPYFVEQSSKMQPVLVDRSIVQNYSEQEIIVVNLFSEQPLSKPLGEKLTPNSDNDWWVSCRTGEIDPRPRLMAHVQDNFDRIFAHGGIFIIFADQKPYQEIVLASFQYGELGIVEKLDYDNWSFLSELNGVYVNNDQGNKILVKDDTVFSSLLAQHFQDCGFKCTLSPTSYITDRWEKLATSKFGDCVAAAITPKNEADGWIFVFPPVKDVGEFLFTLLTEILPEISPSLFPHVVGTRWVYRPEYELPNIRNIQDEISSLKEDMARRISSLESIIDIERSNYGFLYDLLRSSGDELVKAVERSLKFLGFRGVVNIDEELQDNGVSDVKQEDLQIREDELPLLLVEIKGITQQPKDTAIMQVEKYLLPRARQLNRTDIQGLFILNHQRHIPALDRNNPFREEVVMNAKSRFIGLMTTWDLFRLTRNFMKHNWSHDKIRNIFYKSGVIDPVPSHYFHVGHIEKFWEQHGAIGVRIENGSISLKDRIAFGLSVDYEEQTVESLQVDRQSVDMVKANDLAGIKTSFSKSQMQKGVKVYVVQK